MNRANEVNINTKTWWNGKYDTPDQREEYLHTHTGKTARFDKAADEVKDGDKVIDFGCGIGVFTELVKERYPNCEVWGTDISDAVVLANMAKGKDITYLHQYVGHQDKVPDAHFDVVFSGEVLEHLDDPNDLFQDALRALKPGGKFIVTTPLQDAIRSEEHTWFFSHEDVESLYLANGFKDVRFIFLPDMEHLLVIMAVGIKKDD